MEKGGVAKCEPLERRLLSLLLTCDDDRDALSGEFAAVALNWRVAVGGIIDGGVPKGTRF